MDFHFIDTPDVSATPLGIDEPEKVLAVPA
jgi:hypothetical protein